MFLRRTDVVRERTSGAVHTELLNMAVILNFLFLEEGAPASRKLGNKCF